MFDPRSDYIYRATVIANKKRDLDREFQNLVKEVRADNPEFFTAKSDFYWSLSDAAEGFSHYLTGREAYLKYLCGD